jgi:SAM-dependent methyltransferase
MAVEEPDRADRDAQRLAEEALAANEPTAWFERLYAEARTGNAVVPWDRGTPHPLLVEWAQERGLNGADRRAVVVGSGPGHDAGYLAGLGFTTTGFDISDTAIRAARERFPGSGVEFVAADLLDLPAAWDGAFDLVVEIMTVQALPDPPRQEAIAHVSRLVAPAGTLLVIAAAHEDGERPGGPPWPLTRSEIDAFAATGLEPVEVEDVELPGHPQARRWRAVFHRTG